MLDRDQANDIFDKLRRLSQADEVELLISGGRSALTRFANNTIHQNVAEEEYHISVRSAFGSRTARASTNKHDDESLRRVVQSSEALAQVQHPDPDVLPMPTKEEVAAAAVDCGGGPVSRYFESHGAAHSARPCPGRRLHRGSCEEAQSSRCRHLLVGRGGRRYFQFEGRERLVRADSSRSLGQYARQLIFRMAKGELTGRRAARPDADGGNRRGEGNRIEESS